MVALLFLAATRLRTSIEWQNEYQYITLEVICLNERYPDAEYVRVM